MLFYSTEQKATEEKYYFLECNFMYFTFFLLSAIFKLNKGVKDSIYFF